MDRGRRFIRAGELQNGMKVDRTVTDGLGRTLIAYGVVLDDFMIRALPRLGISGVYVSGGREDESTLCTTVSDKASRVIEKLMVPDRTKVKLTESVKKRVVEGIQFLYKDTGSVNFKDTANSIARDLMKAITDNDAIAFDIDMLKVSDEYTFKHSVDVATMAMVIAKHYGLSQKEIYEIGVAGLLHDIGKAKIPSEVLNKRAKLTDDEFEMMKQHSTYGYHILKEKGNIPESILMGVLQHHEKLNGKGYPLGVGQEQISLYARIISIADIYDALVTERPYKKAFTQRDAVEMIMAMSEELDVIAMRSFLDSVILYPMGSIVQLSNGEMAKVVENNEHNTLRPKVVGTVSGNVYDLSEDVGCANLIIM